MVNWQITAKTIYCETVADEVTLLVYKDGRAKCTGLMKHGGNGKSGRHVKCDAANCPSLNDYKNKLFAEENADRTE